MTTQSSLDFSGGCRRGIVWKIDRFATHDGPGIRTAIYLKGCRMRCTWCSNPEGQSFDPILVFEQEKCIGCRLCLNACPVAALNHDQEDPRRILINRSSCNACGVCGDICPTKALHVWGKYYSPVDLVDVVERDRWIHKRSGGGVTLTGGEPLAQPEFLDELLALCRKRNTHTAVESCGCAEEDSFRKMLEQVDWLFVDLKHLDARSHMKLTGQDNAQIITNTRLASTILGRRGKPFVVRLVVVPGVNDGENIDDLAGLLCSLPWLSYVELLPYHLYGAHKYSLLDRRYGLSRVKVPNSALFERYRRLLAVRNLKVV